jgi:hypothetical protein
MHGATAKRKGTPCVPQCSSSEPSPTTRPLVAPRAAVHRSRTRHEQEGRRRSGWRSGARRRGGHVMSTGARTLHSVPLAATTGTWADRSAQLTQLRHALRTSQQHQQGHTLRFPAPEVGERPRFCDDAGGPRRASRRRCHACRCARRARRVRDLLQAPVHRSSPSAVHHLRVRP